MIFFHSIIAVFILFTFCDFPISRACYLQGSASGECTTKSLDPAWKLANIPFCGGVTLYPICVPKTQSIPANREFPEGRWTNHSTLKKDTWVKNHVDDYVAWRIFLENNASLHKRNTDEYGDPGRIKRRFYKRPDCVHAFKSMACYANFPRCDPERDLTLPTCKSACENFFKSCVYGHDLWRCGQSKYFNGYEPEQPTLLASGNMSYLRDYFPGQPFRKNKYNRKGGEIPICTPAVRGAAASSSSKSSFLIPFSTMLTLLVWAVWMVWQ